MLRVLKSCPRLLLDAVGLCAMKRPRPLHFSQVAWDSSEGGEVAALHAPMEPDVGHLMQQLPGDDAASMSLEPQVGVRGIISHEARYQAVLHDTDAVLNASLLPSEAVLCNEQSVMDEDDVGGRSGSGNGPDENYVDLPDPEPSDKDWVTAGKVKGFQGPGQGRALGSGLDVRLSLRAVSTVVFCRDALSVLLRDGLLPGFHADAVDRVNEVRSSLSFYSDKKMNARVFSLSSIGHVGVVAKFGRSGPRSKTGLHQAAAIELTVLEDGDEEVVCACSCAEQCLRTGCTFSVEVTGAFQRVSTACGVRPCELLRAFRSRLGPPRAEGEGHLFGDILCAVRSVGGNWPWALVRKSRANFWTCLSCTEQGLACTHGECARVVVSESAAEGEADGEDDNEEEEVDRMTPLERIMFTYRRSHKPRAAVPSEAAFVHEAVLRQHALKGTRFTYKFVDTCPSCQGVFLLGGHRGIDAARVKFEDGAADCFLKWWLCTLCDLKVMPDGLAEGVIFSSGNTGFSEEFLFNVAYGLVSNGSSLSGSAQLRRRMVELSGNIRLPLAACDLRALRALRLGMMLYLELVVAGMPPAVLQCQCCVLSNGSYKVLCFDGLYVGSRAKHRRDMTRIKVALDIAAGAVASCSLVSDIRVVLALSCGLRHAQADSKGKIEALHFKSIGAVKGAVYAIATLSPEVLFDLPGGAQDGGDEGDPESEHGLPQFDPVKENKVHPALVDFIRTVLLGKDVSIVLARAVMDSSSDIRAKLPAPMLARLKTLTEAAAESGLQDLPPQCPDRRRAATFDEPALVDTGGTSGTGRGQRPKVAVHPSFPTTVNAALRIVSFVRALCAETVFPWSTHGDWSAVQQVIDTLVDRNWSEERLEVTLKDPRVRQLRVLRGAVACLAPAMASFPHVRRALRAVFVAVIDRAGQYDRFIQADGDDPIEGEPPLTRHSVASGDLGRPVTPIEFEQLWLVQPLVLNSLRDVYGDKRVAAASDFHRSGIFCPLLPPLRPGLDFQNGGRRTEKDSTCEKDYGCADGWTPGTFGVFCCCSHPKCIAVIMMDGHEGPRMPLDFVVSRMPTLPSSIIYDFACGTHKAAACRVPRVAKLVNTSVDAFIFGKATRRALRRVAQHLLSRCLVSTRHHRSSATLRRSDSSHSSDCSTSGTSSPSPPTSSA